MCGSVFSMLVCFEKWSESLGTRLTIYIIAQFNTVPLSLPSFSMLKSFSAETRLVKCCYLQPSASVTGCWNKPSTSEPALSWITHSSWGKNKGLLSRRCLRRLDKPLVKIHDKSGCPYCHMIVMWYCNHVHIHMYNVQVCIPWYRFNNHPDCVATTRHMTVNVGVALDPSFGMWNSRYLFRHFDIPHQLQQMLQGASYSYWIR